MSVVATDAWLTAPPAPAPALLGATTAALPNFPAELVEAGR